MDSKSLTLGLKDLSDKIAPYWVPPALRAGVERRGTEVNQRILESVGFQGSELLKLFLPMPGIFA